MDLSFITPEYILNRQKENPGGQIVWLLNGEEVGRDVLMEKSLGEERRELAYMNNIESYNNFLFIDKKGKVRTEGNSCFLDGEPMGKLCGRQYQELLKLKQQNKNIN